MNISEFLAAQQILPLIRLSLHSSFPLTSSYILFLQLPVVVSFFKQDCTVMVTSRHRNSYCSVHSYVHCGLIQMLTFKESTAALKWLWRWSVKTKNHTSISQPHTPATHTHTHTHAFASNWRSQRSCRNGLSAAAGSVWHSTTGKKK